MGPDCTDDRTDDRKGGPVGEILRTTCFPDRLSYGLNTKAVTHTPDLEPARCS